MKIIDPNQSNTAAALEIQQAIDEVGGFVSSKLNRIYDLVNTDGRQQAILDRIGVNGAAALQAYVAFQQATQLIAPNSVPAADPAVFAVQEDGSIQYIEPEPAEIP